MGDTGSESAEHRRGATWALVAALAWCAGIGVVGAVLWREPALVGLLVIAPLVAAIFAGVLRTVVAALAALGVGLLLGIPDHNFGGANFNVRVVELAAVGLVAVVAAYFRERQDRQLAETAEIVDVERSLRLAAETATRLTALANMLAAATTLEHTARAVRAAAADELGAHAAVLAVGDARSPARALDVQGVADAALADWPDGERDPAGGVWRRRAPLLAPTLAAMQARWPELVAALQADGHRALAIVPLSVGDEVLGTLTLLFGRERAFDDDDTSFLRTLAAQTALSVDRTRRAERERSEAELRSRIATVSGALAAATTPDEVARAAVGNGRRTLRAAAGILRVADGDGMLRVLWAEGRAGHEPVRAPAEGTPEGEVLATGEVLVVAGADELRLRFPGDAERSDLLPGPFVFLPLRSGTGLLGVLSLAFADGRSLSSADLRFLDDLAAQSAQALHRAQLFARARAAGRGVDRERQRLALLAEVTRLLTSSLDPGAVVEGLVDLVAPRLADACVVRVPGPHGLRRVVVRGEGSLVTPEGMEAGSPEPDIPFDAGSPEAEAYRTGRPVVRDVTEELAERARRVGWLPPAAGPVTALSAPLTSRGAVVGVMTFLAGGARGGFGPEEISLAMEVATRAGAALDNANRYQREHDASETLQRAVLPEQLVEPEGLTLSAEYRPGTSGTYAGGDWYDVIALDNGDLFFSVGDVMGKGTSAAALMGQVRAAMRAYAVVSPSPTSVLRRVDHLFDTLGEDRLVTAVVGTLNPQSGEVAMANAGHPPPVVVRCDGHAEVVGAGPSLLLGAGPVRTGADRRPEIRLRLGEGETLVLYSDGLVERRGEDLSTGLARLASAAGAVVGTARAPGPEAGLAPGPARAAAELVDMLAEDGPLADDVVVLTIHRLAAPTAAVAPAGPSVGTATVTLPPDLSSTPAARRWLTAQLAGLPDDVVDSARLLVSELAANVVLHAGTPMEITVRLMVDRLRVEVADASPAMPAPRGYGADAVTGRGLTIFSLLPSDWGIEPRPGGKAVWFEIPLDVPIDLPPGASGSYDAGGRPAVGAGVADAPPGPDPSEQFTLHLLGSPIALMQEASAHYDALYREFRLILEQNAAQREAVPGRLLGLIDQLGTTFTGIGRDGMEQWQQALERGAEQVDLRVTLPTAVGPYVVRYDQLLDEADEYCRALDLLTLPAPPHCLAVRRWFFGEIARQAEGAAPIEWPASEWCRRLAPSDR